MSGTKVVWHPGADGLLHAKGYPPQNPGTGNPDPPPTSDLVYGTTLIGQSYDSYKFLGTNQTTYDTAETDLPSVVSGTPRLGGAVIRRYMGGTGSVGTWDTNARNHMRDGQPCVYSYKKGTSQSTASHKTQLRALFDSKPTTDAHLFLTSWHEPDDDIRGTKSHGMDNINGADTSGSANKAARLAWWQQSQNEVREVLDEAAYVNRTDITFGCIYTIVPYQTTTTVDKWQNYFLPGVWDWHGIDCYNFAWDGSNLYAKISKIMGWLTNMNVATGLTTLVGETGSSRPTQATGTRAQIDANTAAWTSDLLDAFTTSGFVQAAMWWRRAATSGTSNPFSTIMSTPAGFDPYYDAPPIVDVWAQKAHESMITASPQIPWFV